MDLAAKYIRNEFYAKSYFVQYHHLLLEAYGDYTPTLPYIGQQSAKATKARCSWFQRNALYLVGPADFDPLKPGETTHQVDRNIRRKDRNVIFQHYCARPHIAKLVKNISKLSDVKFYPTRRTIQTLLQPITTHLDQ